MKRASGASGGMRQPAAALGVDGAEPAVAAQVGNAPLGDGGRATSVVTVVVHSPDAAAAGMQGAPVANAAHCRICLSDAEPDVEGGAIHSSLGSGGGCTDEADATPASTHRGITPRAPPGELVRLQCNCKGDMALAHRYCAARWFAQQRSNVCEVCGGLVLPMPPGWNWRVRARAVTHKHPRTRHGIPL